MHESFDVLLEHLRRDVDPNVVLEIVDYDWNVDTVRNEDSVRVEIWLKREEDND